MASVTLRAERPVLTVNIGDEREVGVPLTLTRTEYETIGKAADAEAAVFEFFRKYLGDVVDDLGDDDLTALFTAWRDARAALGEPDMGEPSASPTS